MTELFPPIPTVLWIVQNHSTNFFQTISHMDMKCAAIPQSVTEIYKANFTFEYKQLFEVLPENVHSSNRMIAHCQLPLLFSCLTKKALTESITSLWKEMFTHTLICITSAFFVEFSKTSGPPLCLFMTHLVVYSLYWRLRINDCLIWLIVVKNIQLTILSNCVRIDKNRNRCRLVLAVLPNDKANTLVSFLTWPSSNQLIVAYHEHRARLKQRPFPCRIYTRGSAEYTSKREGTFPPLPV